VSSDQLVFLILAAIAGLASVGVVCSSSAVRSALSLVVAFFTLAFVYFTLNAQLLGISQILVYTGAIMVLFLFVIMLLNLGAPQATKEKLDGKVVAGFGLGLALFAIVFMQVVMPMATFTYASSNNAYGTPQWIGRTLFSQYVWPFEVASVLLLIGIVGSILLAKRRI
jgi:NADH-quinone oxidoreductase subunit J